MRNRALSNQFLVVLIFTSLVLIQFFGLAVGYESNGSIRGVRDKFYNSEHEIDYIESLINENMTVNGNLNITPPKGSLEMDNAKLWLNDSKNDTFVYKISVQDGARLQVTNNSQIGFGTDYDFEFINDAVGFFEDSFIFDCGMFSETGLTLRSNFVTFINVTFDDNYIGLICDNATPTIENCIFINRKEAGIKLNNSDVTIKDSDFDTYGSANDFILVNGSKLILVNTPRTESDIILDNSEVHVSWWLSVNVTNHNGTEPLKNATIIIMNKHDENVFEGKTDDLGQVTDIAVTQYVENETYKNDSTPLTITVSKDGYKDKEIKLETFLENTDLDVHLEKLPKTGSVAGKVTDINKIGITGANVTLDTEINKYWGLTGLDGSYLIENIPPGENYTMLVYGYINNLSAYKLGVEDGVKVVEGETTIVDFTLEEEILPVTVKVKVRNELIEAHGATDVNKDSDIWLTFKEPIDNKALEENIELRVFGTDNKILGNLKLKEGDDTYTEFIYTVTGDFSVDTDYTFIIDDGIVGYNSGEPIFWRMLLISFTTQFDPIKETKPANNANEVDPENPGIFIKFDSRIILNKSSIEQSFGIVGEDRVKVSGTYNVEFQLKEVTFIPDQPLKDSTIYTVTIADDLKDAKDNLILRKGDARVWIFTTKDTGPALYDVSGVLVDNESKPIIGAKVTLITNGSEVGEPFTTSETGEFKFIGLEAGIYTLKISAKNYKTVEKNIDVSEGGEQELGNVELSPKAAAEDDDEGFVLDERMIAIISVIIIVIIIIIIIAVLYSRKPAREEYPEEEGEAEVEAAPSSARTYTPPPPPTTTRTRTAPISTPEEQVSAPAHSAFTSQIPIVAPSAHRCDVCGHRLNSSGVCFHCQMSSKYGY